MTPEAWYAAHAGMTLDDLEAWEQVASGVVVPVKMLWCHYCQVGEEGHPGARCWICGDEMVEARPRCQSPTMQRGCTLDQILEPETIAWLQAGW